MQTAMAQKQNHIFTRVRAGSQAEKLAEALTERNGPTDGRQISTIAQLVSAGMALKIECMACKEAEVLAGKSLEKKAGKETSLRDVDIACGSCGSTAVSRLPVSVS